jgi:iron complex transport system substrate-binding protein
LGCADEYRTIVDSRGVAVQVPTDIERVVTMSDGMIEGVMTSLGIQDKIVGLGSSSLQRTWNYTYESVSGEAYSYDEGMNPVTYINPHLMDLPLVAEDAVNYEAVASLDPDVVILRAGDCNFWTNDVNDENLQKAIRMIESLEIPIVVLYGPGGYDKPDISTLSDEIVIIGQLFDREEEAMDLANYIEGQVDMVRERTEEVPDSERPDVLILGLSPSARREGGAGVVFGTDTIESFFIEELAKARNAFQNPGYFKTVSAEHLLALNPDVIVLCTAAGYHPPRELYEAPYYQNLQEMDAIKNHRVSALPWTPWNCQKRLEYPIDVMVIAKAAYPEKFEDIKIHEWVLEFYQNVYGVDEETAIGLRSAQWLDWMLEEDF